MLCVSVCCEVNAKCDLCYTLLPWIVSNLEILETASQVDCKSICSFCSRMKRGRLYAAARREGYNVLALGQHLDDLAESFLMSTFHNGRLRSMKAHYYIKYVIYSCKLYLII